MRRALSESVPEEPPADSEQKVCTFKLRYPDGEVVQRRFLASHTLEVCTGGILLWLRWILCSAMDYYVHSHLYLTSFI